MAWILRVMLPMAHALVYAVPRAMRRNARVTNARATSCRSSDASPAWRPCKLRFVAARPSCMPSRNLRVGH
ncbi:MAG TPA: hypothetical protein DCL71_01520, partial [Bifidobacterium sp.]|nr:hypothetical protein [Bifidobacterium sp.]